MYNILNSDKFTLICPTFPARDDPQLKKINKEDPFEKSDSQRLKHLVTKMKVLID